jgi:hypothetical protein
MWNHTASLVFRLAASARPARELKYSRWRKTSTAELQALPQCKQLIEERKELLFSSIKIPL